MTIQLSVLVWTVICFILLMLILHNLLFKPVLKVMDERYERINKAKEKKAEQEKLTSEYEALCIQKQTVFYEEQQNKIKDEIENIRIDSKREIEAAKEVRLKEVDAFRAEMESKQSDIIDALKVHSLEIATAFADSLIKE